jgi:hypothetical protein
MQCQKDDYILAYGVFLHTVMDITPPLSIRPNKHYIQYLKTEANRVARDQVTAQNHETEHLKPAEMTGEPE